MNKYNLNVNAHTETHQNNLLRPILRLSNCSQIQKLLKYTTDKMDKCMELKELAELKMTLDLLP
jgi:hypothetical protein